MARLPRTLVRTVSVLGLVTAAALFLGLAVGPHVLGYRTLTMRTSSMAPVVEPGDVIVVRSEPVSAVRPGQLLTFEAPVPGRPVYTHRVVTVDRQGEDTLVTTQGDANAAPDPWTARLDGAVAWHVVAVVPALGWVLGALHHPVVHVAGVWLLPGFLCLEVLLRLWRRPRPDEPVSPETRSTVCAGAQAPPWAAQP